MNLKKLFAISIIGTALSLNIITGVFAETEKKETNKISESLNNDKPIVAVVKADWCPSCKKISPTVMAIMKKYEKTTQFVFLDVTNAKTTKEAEVSAKKLGISDFFKANKSKTSTVAIINSKTKDIIKTFQGESDKKAYEIALNSIIKKSN